LPRGSNAAIAQWAEEQLPAKAADRQTQSIDQPQVVGLVEKVTEDISAIDLRAFFSVLIKVGCRRTPRWVM